ncbi:MerR family transcriptional regulator [Streptococcus hyointestinalis]|uniref:MerR family transcriptional regulator n=1 Tax=Streptococcus hyointestinalis TaxID=1337 RepID=UPI003518AB4A
MAGIKDIAEQFHISAHSIRYYEKEGLISIPRDEHGNRQFDDKAISRMKAIVYYRHLGLSISEIRDLLADFHNHEKSLTILNQHLADLRVKIQELKATEDYILEKIELHELLLSLEKAGKSKAEQDQAYQEFIKKR